MSLPPPLPTAAVPRLTDEQFRQLATAQSAIRKVRRAISVANFDGWTVGICGALTLLFGITSVSGVVLGLGLIVVAWVELRGVVGLRRLDPTVPRQLGWNQVALGVMLILYAISRIYLSMNEASPYAQEIAADPALATMLQPIGDLTRQVTMLAYGAIIVIAVLA